MVSKRLDRRVDAARCVILVVQRLVEPEPEAGEEMLTRAARSFGDLGVKHLSEQALGLVR